MDVILGPDDLVRLVLEQFFGRASMVVFMWVLITVAIAWIQLARQAGQARTTVVKFFSSSRQIYGGRSAKVRATLQLCGIWVALYGVASIVTQIWAGSAFSPGQGGGVAELLSWSALFGLLTVIGTLLLLPSAYADGGIFITPFVGYVVGLISAAVTFTQKGGPRPGDWWVAPAASCCLVLVAASYARLKYASQSRNEESA